MKLHLSCPARPRPYSLLYVTGWHPELNEPEGGRLIGTFETLAEARAAHADLVGAAPRIWGHGHLVVTDDDGECVHASPEIMKEAREARERLLDSTPYVFARTGA